MNAIEAWRARREELKQEFRTNGTEYGAGFKADRYLSIEEPGLAAAMRAAYNEGFLS